MCHLLTQVGVQAGESEHLSKSCRHPRIVYSEPLENLAKKWKSKTGFDGEMGDPVLCDLRGSGLLSVVVWSLSFFSREHVGSRVELPSHDTDRDAKKQSSSRSHVFSFSAHGFRPVAEVGLS